MRKFMDRDLLTALVLFGIGAVFSADGGDNIKDWIFPLLATYLVFGIAVALVGLVVFPEGHTVWQNDTVMPFQQGLIHIAFHAAEEASKADSDASLFCVPIAVQSFALNFFDHHPVVNEKIDWVGVTSPFSAAFAVPLNMTLAPEPEDIDYGNWPLFGSYVAFTAMLNIMLLVTMIWLFNVRWRVSG